MLHLIAVFATFVSSVASYGFSFPRFEDRLVVGETVTIAWESVDDFVDIYLTAKQFLGNAWPVPPVTVAENITNRGSYEWTIPTDLDATFTYASTHLYLVNSGTKSRSFPSQYLNILVEPPDPSFTAPTPTWARFMAPTGAPNTSLVDRQAVNISWETDVEFINLTYLTDVNAPWSIIDGFTVSTGSYRWTVNDITTFSLPTRFRLMTNDTSVGDEAVDSDGFYTAPLNYPDKFDFNTYIDDEGFLFPTKALAPNIRVNDTVVFTWREPLPDDYDIQLGVWSETYKDGWITDENYDDIIRTPTNPTAKISTYSGVDNRFRQPYTFRLLSLNSRSCYPGHRLIMQTEPMTFGDPVGEPATTWTAPAAAFETGEVPSSPSDPTSPETSAAAQGCKDNRLAIGLCVGLGVGGALILLGVGVFCWRKRRKDRRRLDKRGKSRASNGQPTRGESFRKPELGCSAVAYELSRDGEVARPPAELPIDSMEHHRRWDGAAHEMPGPLSSTR